MKKLTALLLAVFMGITGCSFSGKGSDDKTPGPSASEASVNEENQEPEGEYQIISPEETPAGLAGFLSGILWAVYGPNNEYDCSDGREAWIVPYLGPMTGYFYSYPVNTEPTDGYEYEGYLYLDEKDGDWMLSNIFNFPPETLQKIKEEHTVYGMDSEELVYVDGQYRVMGPYGAGDNINANILGTAFNGKYYLVTYECCAVDFQTGELVPEKPYYRYYAILEYKQIDGKGWWSIYKATIHPEEIEGCKELFPEEDEPADNDTVEDFTDWNYVAEQYYEIYLGYLEFINAKGDTSKLVNLIPEQEERFKYNYVNYKVGHVYTNQVFDFDVSASRIVETSPGVYEADCYVFFSNRDELIETGEVTINNRTIHGTMRYDPTVSKWLLTGQEGFTYSYEGHMMIHCAK